MIQTEQATKRFGDLLAVDHVNTRIEKGSVYGWIGSNGAGKSTFLRMLAGILQPDEGRCKVMNRMSMRMKRSAAVFLYFR